MINFLTQIKTDSSLFQSCQMGLQQLLKRDDIGFFKLPERDYLWQSVQAIAPNIRKNFSHFVVVGIGGSSLGARAFVQALNSSDISFVDNVDGRDFDLITNKLPLTKTFFVFISKSGNTIETLTALDFLQQVLEEQGLQLFKQAAVVTENKKSSLSDWAQKNHVPLFEVPTDVGGRFSVLSPVGMLPAALAGYDIDGFRKGARAALLDSEKIASMMAQTLQSFQEQKWISLFWFYNSRMEYFGAWLQQLWAESLAKRENRHQQPAPRVSTPMWAIGAIDQHSILQQVMEGDKDKWILFHRFDCAEGGGLVLQSPQFPETQVLRGKKLGELLKAEAIATEQALRAQGIPTTMIQTKVLDEESLGYLFMFWMLVVGGLGEMLNIDAFNQPGVEAGKIIAKEILKNNS
ncbi:MAG: glucose-6-phosphate isomerase [Bdellovibrionia bacterium]